MALTAVGGWGLSGANACSHCSCGAVLWQRYRLRCARPLARRTIRGRTAPEDGR
jgi:hypothetical protein